MESNKKTFLDMLHYDNDKQRGNLEVAFAFKDKEGNPKWSKWKKYLDAQSDEKFLSKVNNRAILPNEIVLDIEEPEKFERILKQVKKDFDFYSAYQTGSRGFHIHLWFKEDLTSEEKLAVIKKYQTDEQKAGDRCMIALENCPHWKTGNPKVLIEGEHKEGFNDVVKVKKILKQEQTKQKREKLKTFLQEKRKKFESLGCGFHNGVFYEGGKVFKKGQSYDAVITSDKNMFVNTQRRFGREIIGEDEIKLKFGLNYKESFYDESLDNIFSKKAIWKWLFENCDDIILKEVYEEFIKILKKYIYFEDERKYSLLACYRIAGFFMPIWRVRARLFLYAEFGTAKSRLTQIMHNTGFNSVSLGDWTLAYLKTIIESTRGETHIDDFETLPEELKNATIRLVKVGYMKGFKAGKMSDGAKRKPEVNDLFNTTTLNNTKGLDFISSDRTIIIRIPKISKKEYDKEPNFEEKFWNEIRDKLYILGLKYAEQVKENYETIKSEKIRGRLFSIIKPELTIAKLISEQVYNDLEEFWIEEIGQRNIIDYQTDWEFNALKQIYKLLSTHSTNSTLSTHSTLSTTEYFTLLDDVVKPIGLELYNEEEFKKKKRSMSIIIGNSLKQKPIFKSRLVKGKTQYKVDFQEFKSLLEAKAFLNPILDILGISKEKEVDKVDSVERESDKTSITTQKIQGKDIIKKQKNDFSKSGIKEFAEQKGGNAKNE